MSVVTICGSYQFVDMMECMYRSLTNQGEIVLMPAIGCAGRSKEWYRRLHFSKIEMSDYILVVDRDFDHSDSYIGDDTRAEINYAVTQQKRVVYMSNVFLHFQTKSDTPGGLISREKPMLL